MFNLVPLFNEIIDDPGKLPMSWKLAGERYSGFPANAFKRVRVEKVQSPDCERATVTLTGGEGLIIEIILARYPLFGALEWTVWFKNEGASVSPVISDVYEADMLFPGDAPILRGILGDHENDYRPYARDLSVEPVRFYSDLGRPTHVYFPYFNLECGDGGCLIALGWGGTWEASFTAEEGHTRFKGHGCNDLKTYLKPGEKIRTALMAFLPYEGRNEDAAMNLWRRWYIAHNLPRAAGEPIKPFSTTCIADDTGRPNSDGSISETRDTWRPSLEKMLSEGVRLNYRWFDAGWYTDPFGKTVPADWWGTVGNWELDPEKWPGDSFRESTDFARAHGMKTLMWFEPERVTHVDALIENYGYKREWALGDPNSVACGNDIGQSECLDWTCARIFDTLGKCGVEMYREDNNFDSRPCWAARDAQQGENRGGITENKAVIGHYEMWDRIIAFTKSHGGDAFVDSCSSGGGRNDLESMRRAVPLLRSDLDRTSISLRLSMTTAFDRWIPFCGASCVERSEQLSPSGRRDKYILRASYLPVFNMSAQWTQDPNTDFDMIRWGLEEWRAVAPYLLCDFHVLTPWRSKDDRGGWTAYAYWDSENARGVLQAFRMEEAGDASQTLSLCWLEPDAKYAVRNGDAGEAREYTGRELAAFEVNAMNPRTALVFWIEKK